MIKMDPIQLNIIQAEAFEANYALLFGLRESHPTLHALTTPHKETLMTIAAGMLCVPVAAFCVTCPEEGRVFLAQVRNDVKAARHLSSKPWELLHECAKLDLLIARLKATHPDEDAVLDNAFRKMMPYQPVHTVMWGIYKTLIDCARLMLLAQRTTYPREDKNRLAEMFADLSVEWLAPIRAYLSDDQYPRERMLHYATSSLDYDDDHVEKIKFPDPKF